MLLDRLLGVHLLMSHKPDYTDTNLFSGGEPEDSPDIEALWIRCPRCGSEVYLEGVTWPDPEDYADGDTTQTWVTCHAEASGGGDPMGEFNDGEGCDEWILVTRAVLSDSTLGPAQVPGSTRGRVMVGE